MIGGLHGPCALQGFSPVDEITLEMNGEDSRNHLVNAETYGGAVRSSRRMRERVGKREREKAAADNGTSGAASRREAEGGARQERERRSCPGEPLGIAGPWRLSPLLSLPGASSSGFQPIFVSTRRVFLRSPSHPLNLRTKIGSRAMRVIKSSGLRRRWPVAPLSWTPLSSLTGLDREFRLSVPSSSDSV